MNVSKIFKNLDFRNFNFQKFYVHSIHQIQKNKLARRLNYIFKSYLIYKLVIYLFTLRKTRSL
jgi:hypothetical protein